MARWAERRRSKRGKANNIKEDIDYRRSIIDRFANTYMCVCSLKSLVTSNLRCDPPPLVTPFPAPSSPPLAPLHPSFIPLPPLDIPSTSQVEITHFRVFKTKALQTDGRTDGRTDRRTDGRTDRPSCTLFFYKNSFFSAKP